VATVLQRYRKHLAQLEIGRLQRIRASRAVLFDLMRIHALDISTIDRIV